ncbi:MAG TPA: chloride channel protein [Turneriella sp.]|nr:chloride channel protein [Turneriella sp.]
MYDNRFPRAWITCTLSIPLGFAAVIVAKYLLLLIAIFTNLFFYGRFSIEEILPWQHQLGYFVILMPVVGAFFIGFLARFGSPGIRGHGIPEAMEKILTGESRVPRRITVLKPLSAALAIGSGGPFGAEGPIIATGGALGSWLGQLWPTAESERKILLACGAAAGMTAIFGTPIASIFLAIELLLFEFRTRSFIPVMLAVVTAGSLRSLFFHPEPVFAVPLLHAPNSLSMVLHFISGALYGLVAVGASKIIYIIEDGFEKLPLHWMWWPALGAIAIGVCGFFEVRSLGVGYSNITDTIAGKFGISALFSILIFKFISWAIALGSGTSGGTLAPLLTFGACVGFLFGLLVETQFPNLHFDKHTAALVGMAAVFAGASRAVLASAAFAVEVTGQYHVILPVLGACASAYLVSRALLKYSIMTEKIERRGIPVPHEYFPIKN